MIEIDIMKFEIHHLATCDSTNDVAKARAREGAPVGTVIVADAQTEGRGTKGRRWYSPPGLGLYVSVLLRPPETTALTLLPLAAGLAARDAVSQGIALETRLRWPNDIVRDGKKLGGVLAESGFFGLVAKYAVIGLGLNLNHAEDDFPEELRSRSTSLFLESGRTVEAGPLLDAFLKALAARAAPWLGGGTSEIVADFLAFSESRPGDGISLSTAAGTVTGRFAGLDPSGALLLSTSSGDRRFVSAEITAFAPALK
jgi:BirA family biotin operon repressor/biotin-[acetyl-CoA-carboxylase] ligase